MLPKCITNLYIKSFKTKHLCKLEACFSPLRCVSGRDKVHLPIQKSLPNCHFSTCNLATYITLSLSGKSSYGHCLQMPLSLMLQIKNIIKKTWCVDGCKYKEKNLGILG